MLEVSQTKNYTVTKECSTPITNSKAGPAPITVTKGVSQPVTSKSLLRVVDHRYQFDTPQSIAKAVIDAVIAEGTDSVTLEILSEVLNGEILQVYAVVPTIDGNSAAFNIMDTDMLPCYESEYKPTGTYTFNVSRPTGTELSRPYPKRCMTN